MISGYRLGLPAWAHVGWRQGFFAPQDSRWLAQYSSVFNCVEGNATFYALPQPAVVANWAEQLQGRDLRMHFKLPREVTHGGRLAVDDRLQQLWHCLTPLLPHLGAYFIQLPPKLGADRQAELEAFLSALPKSFTYWVELRNPCWFDGSSAHRWINRLLERLRMGRVVLDSRPIYRGDAQHPQVRDAVHEKPDLPVHPDVISQQVMVRLICHPEVQSNEPYFIEWAKRIHGWIQLGLTPTLMIHCPDDDLCPWLAQRFHAHLRQRASVGAELVFPIARQSGQLSMF